MDNTDDVTGLKLELIGLLVKAGKPYDLATEAVDTLGLGADWDELLTYGEDGEPEAQVVLSKHRG